MNIDLTSQEKECQRTCGNIKEEAGEQKAAVFYLRDDQACDFPRTGGCPGTFSTEVGTTLPIQPHSSFTLTLMDYTFFPFCILLSSYRRFVFM